MTSSGNDDGKIWIGQKDGAVCEFMYNNFANVNNVGTSENQINNEFATENSSYQNKLIWKDSQSILGLTYFAEKGNEYLYFPTFEGNVKRLRLSENSTHDRKIKNVNKSEQKSRDPEILISISKPPISKYIVLNKQNEVLTTDENATTATLWSLLKVSRSEEEKMCSLSVEKCGISWHLIFAFFRCCREQN